MSTLVTVNIILWLSVFAVFMPQATDKQASIDDAIVIKHKLDNEGV